MRRYAARLASLFRIPLEAVTVPAWFVSLHPTLQALLAGLFTWTITAIGAAAVFWTNQVHRKLLDAMLGFSGGVMLAASYWSLLAPAIEIAQHARLPAWLPPSIGFLLGGGVLWLFDRLLPHLHLGFRLEEAEGPKTSLQGVILLVAENRTARAMSTRPRSA